jgi:hypothetical protein
MPAARHASRGDEKRGDQAAVSPLPPTVVETGKRGDLDPGRAHGGARAAPRASFAEAVLWGACRAWHHDAAMGELELTRSPGDRRLYALADIGTVRLKGWASRAARAEANGRTWEIARRGLLRPAVEASDEAGRTVGQFRARSVRRGGTLRWIDRELMLRPAGRWRERFALADGDRELAVFEGKRWGRRPVKITVDGPRALDPGLLLFAAFVVRGLWEDASAAAGATASGA